MAVSMSLSTAGLRSSKPVTSPESRSTPRVSWVRSLEPMEKPSRCRRKSSASKAFAGISHMRYTLSPAFPRSSPCARMTASTFFASSTLRTNGIITTTLSSPMSSRTCLSPAHPEHGIFLPGLEAGAAEQRGVFVRFEIAQAHDDRLGVKRGGDGANTFGEAADKVGAAVRISSRQPVDVPLFILAEFVIFQQRARVRLDAVIDDEFQAREPHAVIRQERIFKGLIGIADIYHDFRARPVRGIRRYPVDAEFLLALVDTPGIALGATHRHLHAGADDLGGVAATHDRRDAQLTRDNGGVTGAPATVGDNPGGGFHYRLPVGVGHVGHQHLAGA